MHRFRVHEPFDTGEVANQFTGRETSGASLPLEILVAHADDDSACALVHAIEIVDEWRNPCDFH
jgi:hypothetical protein